MSDVGADELNREQVVQNVEAGEAVPEPVAPPAPPPAPSAPDHEAAVGHLMLAVEQMASLLSHAQAAVPALMGMGAQIAALFSHLGNARKALNPPVDIPPKE